MRTKDLNKKQAIYLAAMTIINENGLANSSISKIAKEAGVSASTIYVYFENKEDMLNKLFMIMKEEIGQIVLKGYDETMSVKDGLGIFMKNIFHYMQNNPIKFSFQEQFYNSPCICETSKEFGMAQYHSVIALFQRGVKEKLIKNYPIFLVKAFVFSPIVSLVWAQKNNEFEVDEEVIEKVIEMAWNALKI